MSWKYGHTQRGFAAKSLSTTRPDIPGATLYSVCLNMCGSLDAATRYAPHIYIFFGSFSLPFSFLSCLALLNLIRKYSKHYFFRSFSLFESVSVPASPVLLPSSPAPVPHPNPPHIIPSSRLPPQSPFSSSPAPNPSPKANGRARKLI